MTHAPAAASGGYLTTGEVAVRIGGTPQHVRRLISSGRLPAINIARGSLRPRFRVPEVAVEEFLRAALVAPEEAV